MGITGIVIDSLQVRPGDLFIAPSGGSADDHHYIADAIARGAAAVVGGSYGHDAGVDVALTGPRLEQVVFPAG